MRRHRNSEGRRGRRSVRVPAAAAAVLVGLGGTVIGVAACGQQAAPQPSRSAAGHLPGSSAPSSSSATGRPGPSGSAQVTRQTVGASRPTTITIPAIGVHDKLLRLGLTSDGTIRVPQPGSNYDKPAWYNNSPTPGQVGAAVIEGHVDSARNGPSVFFKLGSLKPGDTVRIHREDHSTVTFRIDAVRRYPKEHFPTMAVYGDADRPELRLITCGGSFDSGTGHYRDNIIAFATLKSSHR